MYISIYTQLHSPLVFFFRGMFLSDHSWSSCCTLSDGKHNNNNLHTTFAATHHTHAQNRSTAVTKKQQTMMTSWQLLLSLSLTKNILTETKAITARAIHDGMASASASRRQQRAGRKVQRQRQSFRLTALLLLDGDSRLGVNPSWREAVKGLPTQKL